MHPDKSTIGRFWMDDAGELWLQEYADEKIVCFLDGYFEAKTGEAFAHPLRKVIVAGDTEHGLRLLDEPIKETLNRERGEAHWDS